jgi:uncharacterized membrane protein YhaH (DUF805 family)
MEKYVSLYKQLWVNWKNYTDKTNLNDFWTTVVIHLIFETILGFLIGLIGVPVITWIVSVVLLVPVIALGVRRLHDVGKPTNYIFWGLLPLVGQIMLILQWVKPSKAA